jgi:hypothetical protein
MWPTNGQRRMTTTNNKLDNVYRGIYYYKVTKAGYKPIQFTLNLVDGDGDKLDCELYKGDQIDGPSPCILHR